jgi:uncharacterized protein
VRNLLIFLLVLFGVWWVRRALSGAKRGRGTDESAAQQAQAENRSVEHMVECAHCGVHVPEVEGVRDGARFYCSEAHRLAGPAKRD